MIGVKHKGSFDNIKKFFERMQKKEHLRILERYGQEGVDALRAATPVDSGETAGSWYYEIEQQGDRTILSWFNSNVNNHVNIALILQYGHGTGTGGYVAGIDYINPAMRPVFERIADEAWKEVTEA